MRINSAGVGEMGSSGRVRLATMVAILGLMGAGNPGNGWAEGAGRMLFFNTLGHLLKGDTWQWITQDEVNRHLYVFPENHRVIGMGTTNWPERMGEVMVRGTIGKTIFQWANPEYPYQVRNLREGAFPWIQVAIVNPKRGLSLTMERTQDLHAALIDRMRGEGIRLCAFSMEADTQQVEYSITYRIPKTGLDLSVPKGKAAYVRAFQDETRGRWFLWGIYVDEEMAQSCGMIPGQPLLLVGFNRDTNNGGLVKLAKVQSVQVQYYPIDTFQVFKSELVVSDLRIHEGRVSIDVRNDGALTAEHVKVRLSLPDSKREMDAVLSAIKPREEVTLRFNLKRSPQDRSVQVQVDPDNQILESDDNNNRLEKRHGLLGW